MGCEARCVALRSGETGWDRRGIATLATLRQDRRAGEALECLFGQLRVAQWQRPDPDSTFRDADDGALLQSLVRSRARRTDRQAKTVQCPFPVLDPGGIAIDIFDIIA